MPLFDFRCEDCDQAFEELVGHDETPPCPKCKSTHIERLLPIFAVNTQHDAPLPPGGCGTCGDPRGPGSCSM